LVKLAKSKISEKMLVLKTQNKSSFITLLALNRIPSVELASLNISSTVLLEVTFMQECCDLWVAAQQHQSKTVTLL